MSSQPSQQIWRFAKKQLRHYQSYNSTLLAASPVLFCRRMMSPFFPSRSTDWEMSGLWHFTIQIQSWLFQTSCEPPLPVVQMQLKMYFFVPSVLPCLHHNYGVISGSHACRDCQWRIKGGCRLGYSQGPPISKSEKRIICEQYTIHCKRYHRQMELISWRSVFTIEIASLT